MAPEPIPNGNNPSPIWWLMLRRVVTFFLGVIVILDSLVEQEQAQVGKLIVGTILVGALPLDDLVRVIDHRVRRRRVGEHEG